MVEGITTNWSQYLDYPIQGMTIEEQMRVFKGEAFDIWRYSRCEQIGLPYLPRVVERSGGTLYHGSRSISEPFSNYDFVTNINLTLLEKSL